jgi:hypothetical protein
LTHLMAIAIREEEGWPIEAVLADRDDPEGALRPWTDGAFRDAPEIDVDEVLADPSWRWLNIDLPENLEEGYLASWRGKVKWVRGTPQIVPWWLPRWMLAIPNPDRAERLQRRLPLAVMIAGGFGFIIGLALIVAGDSHAWFNTVWAIVLLWQGLAMRHRRAWVRTFATRVVPLLLISIAAALSARAAAQAFSSNNAARGWMFLAVALLDLLLVVLLVALGRVFADRAKPTPRGSH